MTPLQLQPTDSRASGVSPAAQLRQAAISLGIGYAASVVAYAALRPLLGARDGWIELADDLEPWGYLPAPLLGLAGAALGSRGLSGAGAVLAAAFGLRWGFRYLRRPPEPAQVDSDLTVMTFNTLAWERSSHDIAAVIRAAQPDMVGLQEIGGHGADQLCETLRDEYPYTYITPSPDSSGAAVFSKYRLRDTVAFRASEMGHWWQRMIVDTPRGPITYINLHTKIPHIHTVRLFGRLPIPARFHAERRRREVRWLCAMLARTDGPVIVGGDFNMTERSQDYAMLSKALHDAYRSAGVGLGHTFPKRGVYPRTFPAPWPTLRLDYVWHSDHFEAAWAYRGDAGESDHHPVVTGLRWSDTIGLAGDATVPLAASAV